METVVSHLPTWRYLMNDSIRICFRPTLAVMAIAIAAMSMAPLAYSEETTPSDEPRASVAENPRFCYQGDEMVRAITLPRHHKNRKTKARPACRPACLTLTSCSAEIPPEFIPHVRTAPRECSTTRSRSFLGARFRGRRGIAQPSGASGDGANAGVFMMLLILFRITTQRNPRKEPQKVAAPAL